MENKNLNNYLLQIQEGYLFHDKTISIDLHKFESGEKDKLLIVGFAGSGKSTLGRKLSKKYNCEYYELDNCLGSDYIKCCYEKIKTSKEKAIVEGCGICSSYFENYQNIKKFILEQPIIFMGMSFLISFFRAVRRNISQEKEMLKRIEKWEKYDVSLFDEEKFGSFLKQIKKFRKERISQKNSVVKLYKV